MKTSGSIAVISGPSGVGKDALMKELAVRSPYRKLATYTTRLIRPNERDGSEYHFLTHQQFAELRIRHEFLDCTEINGNLYGTPLDVFERVIEEGRHAVVHLKAQSALLLHRRVSSVRTVFMLPPSAGELERRLRTRGTSEEDIAIRMKSAEEVCTHAIFFDLIVVNYTNEIRNTVERILRFLDER